MVIGKEGKKQTESVTKGAKKVSAKVLSMADDVLKELNKRVEGAGISAKQHSAGAAVTLIDLQRSAFDRALNVLGQVQKQGDKLLKEHVEEASWMPAEGKDIIKEWNRTLNDGRGEFQKTVDKSCDLLRTLFDRVEKKQQILAKQRDVKSNETAKAAGGAPKKAPVKKKRAAKKKVTSIM
jgi:hypothetical protein